MDATSKVHSNVNLNAPGPQEEKVLSNVVNGQVINGVEVIKNDEVDTLLKTLPREGKLIQGPRDSYILDLSNNSEPLDQMYDYLVKEYGDDLLKGSVGDVGYHVSVIRASVGDRVISPGEMGIALGENFSFEPHFLCSIEPSAGQWEKLWLVEVKAKALEKIRTDLGMGPKINVRGRELEFHISIANKPRLLPS